MNDFGLVPIRNFAMITDKLFRSAQPEYQYEYEWLRNVVEIKSMINLRSEINIDKIHCAALGIESISFAVTDHHPPTEQQALHFIDIVKKCQHPTLFHCEHGHGRTSTFNVLARIAGGWGITRAIEEERKHFHYNFKHHAQEDWLKEFFNKNKQL